MSAFIEEKVLTVHHWTDRLFSFPMGTAANVSCSADCAIKLENASL